MPGHVFFVEKPTHFYFLIPRMGMLSLLQIVRKYEQDVGDIFLPVTAAESYAKSRVYLFSFMEVGIADA